MARHPKRERLIAWFEGEIDPEIDAHLSDCERCTSFLDELSEHRTETPDNVAQIAPRLLTLLHPPDDLHERMSARLAERIQRRADLGLLGSLLGVPLEAGEVLLLPGESKPPVVKGKGRGGVTDTASKKDLSA